MSVKCKTCHDVRFIDRDVQVREVGPVAMYMPCPDCSNCELCDEPIGDDTERMFAPDDGACVHQSCWLEHCRAEGLCWICGGPLPYGDNRFASCGCEREDR